MNEQQIREMERYLGRRLTPEEKRLLTYTERQPLRFPDKQPDRRKRKKAAQTG